MKDFKFEIEYFYHPTKEHGHRVHWMYFVARAKTLEAGKELAHKHFTKQMRELGWTKWTTLNEISPPKRANDPANHKTVRSDTLPAKRSSTSTGNAKRKSGTSVGGRRKSSTSKRAAPSKRKKSA